MKFRQSSAEVVDALDVKPLADVPTLWGAAQLALRLPGAERPAPLVVLAADWAMFEALDQQIHDATTQLAALLPDTPAGVLLGIRGVGVLTASSYGAAIGDLNRYRDAAGRWLGLSAVVLIGA